MADEINWHHGLTASKNGQQAVLERSGTLSMTSQQMASFTQTIGTTAEQINFPADLLASGMQMFSVTNTDPTNYIELYAGSAEATPFTKLAPGLGFVLPPYLGSPTYFAKANTAACDLVVDAAGS